MWNKIWWGLLAVLVILVGYSIYNIKIQKPILESKLKTQLVVLAENSYAEGQHDAIKGDIRIKLENDSTVVFIKSPWDSVTTDDTVFTHWKTLKITVH